MKGGGSTTYPQEPLFRPEGPEFEPIPLEKRKIFQFRRGPRGSTLYALVLGSMVFGHYVCATGAWLQRDLYDERFSTLSSLSAYLQAEQDRRYLQTRRAAVAMESVVFDKEIREGEWDVHQEENQFKTRWLPPVQDPFRQWVYARSEIKKAQQ